MAESKIKCEHEIIDISSQVIANSNIITNANLYVYRIANILYFSASVTLKSGLSDIHNMNLFTMPSGLRFKGVSYSTANVVYNTHNTVHSVTVRSADNAIVTHNEASGYLPITTDNQTYMSFGIVAILQ